MVLFSSFLRKPLKLYWEMMCAGTVDIWPPSDQHALREAMIVLETTSFAAKLSALVGAPIETILRLLPESWMDVVYRGSRKAISVAFDLAISSLAVTSTSSLSSAAHRFAAGLSGAVGGFFGAGALLAELPISITIMLRSIAAIASREGEDLTQTEARLACLEVLALGGDVAPMPGVSRYFRLRDALRTSSSEAVRYIATRGIADKSAPAIAQLVDRIAIQFGAPLTQKIAAQSMPVIGAVGGSVLNVLFTDHFQSIAKAHFTIRRLERAHGNESLRAAYQRVWETWSAERFG
ncbi:MAG: EcsC family protein [Pseudomonadota bacterium]